MTNTLLTTIEVGKQPRLHSVDNPKRPPWTFQQYTTIDSVELRRGVQGGACTVKSPRSTAAKYRTTLDARLFPSTGQVESQTVYTVAVNVTLQKCNELSSDHAFKHFR